MRIPYCTLQMVTLIFLLFMSINAGLTHTGPTSADFINQPAERLLSAWGAPHAVIQSSDLGFTTSALATVEVWVYERPARSVVVRDGVVVAIRTTQDQLS
jgi:hypothetical protein